jgi:hypothetical protein
MIELSEAFLNKLSHYFTSGVKQRARKRNEIRFLQNNSEIVPLFAKTTYE